MSECLKTTRRKLCCEKLGTSHDVKIFAIGSFLKRFVVRIAKLSSLLKKTSNTFVKSAQNQSISREICPESSHNIGHFLPIVFRRICLKIPQNLTFFSASYQKPCSTAYSIRFDCLKLSWTNKSV